MWNFYKLNQNLNLRTKYFEVFRGPEIVKRMFSIRLFKICFNVTDTFFVSAFSKPVNKYYYIFLLADLNLDKLVLQ